MTKVQTQLNALHIRCVCNAALTQRAQFSEYISVTYQVTPKIIAFSRLQLGVHWQQAGCMLCHGLISFFVPHDLDFIVRVQLCARRNCSLSLAGHFVLVSHRYVHNFGNSGLAMAIACHLFPWVGVHPASKSVLAARSVQECGDLPSFPENHFGRACRSNAFERRIQCQDNSDRCSQNKPTPNGLRRVGTAPSDWHCITRLSNTAQPIGGSFVAHVDFVQTSRHTAHHR